MNRSAHKSNDSSSVECPDCKSKLCFDEPGYGDPVGPNGEVQWIPAQRVFECGRAEFLASEGIKEWWERFEEGDCCIAV